MWQEKCNYGNKPIVSYVKDRKGNRKGMMISVLIDNEVCFGWSLCMKDDSFDKERGFKIAEARANKYKNSLYNYVVIPTTIMKNFESFSDRIDRYYKDKQNSKFYNSICLSIN